MVGLGDEEALPLRRRWGVMFERGALFGSLTVSENVGLPLREHTTLGDRLIDEIAAVKIALTGLPASAGAKYPSELSGGMRKRAALARAIALDPDLLFLDEPTAGLDPLSASGFDVLVRRLKDLLGLTIFMVTHDLDLLWRVADRVAFMVAGRIAGVGTMQELSSFAGALDPRVFRWAARTRRPGAGMETKVNYALVGAFVLILSVAIIAGVLWIASSRYDGQGVRDLSRLLQRVRVGAEPEVLPSNFGAWTWASSRRSASTAKIPIGSDSCSRSNRVSRSAGTRWRRSAARASRASRSSISRAARRSRPRSNAPWTGAIP